MPKFPSSNSFPRPAFKESTDTVTSPHISVMGFVCEKAEKFHNPVITIVLSKSDGLLQYSDIYVCAEIVIEPDGTILGQ